MKRFLSIALAVMLGVGLFIPTLANGVMMGGPNAPVIIKQPTKNYRSIYIQAGNALNLDALAALPAGAEQGTLSYDWYDYNWQPGDTTLPIATSASVSIPTTKDMLFDLSRADKIASRGAPLAHYRYCVVVTNTWLDDEQVQQTASMKSDVVEVILVADYGTAISIVWDNVMEDGFFMFLLDLPYTILLTFLGLSNAALGILNARLGN